MLAEEAERLGALLVHYSTDYVFDGRKGAPYVEQDEPNPLNVYGASKLDGERAIQTTVEQHIIRHGRPAISAHAANPGRPARP